MQVLIIRKKIKAPTSTSVKVHLIKSPGFDRLTFLEKVDLTVCIMSSDIWWSPCVENRNKYKQLKKGFSVVTDQPNITNNHYNQQGS